MTSLDSLVEVTESSRYGFSLKALLGVHSIAAGLTQFALEAPMIAALLAVAAAFILLQIGVLAACTHHMPRAS
jgi:hypothetical protein